MSIYMMAFCKFMSSEMLVWFIMPPSSSQKFETAQKYYESNLTGGVKDLQKIIGSTCEVYVFIQNLN